MRKEEKWSENRHICETCFFYEKFLDECKTGSMKDNLENCNAVCSKWRIDE